MDEKKSIYNKIYDNILKYLFKIVFVCMIIVCIIFYSMYLFLKSNYNTYNKLINILKSIKGNSKSNFMNYGYWDKDNMTLEEANKKMCDIILNTGKLDKSKNILDVGCGFGEQDFYFADKISSNIDAIDINESSIKIANENNNKDNINFIKKSSTDLLSLNKKYDRVVSLESAFHYNTREKFLNQTYKVLEENGKLVMADILYNDNTNKYDILNYFNTKAFEKIFEIHESNRINIETLKKQLENIGYKNILINDISSKTFKPYYKYFFNNVKKPDNFEVPNFMFNILKTLGDIYINTLCNGTNGFKYVIISCVK